MIEKTWERGDLEKMRESKKFPVKPYIYKGQQLISGMSIKC